MIGCINFPVFGWIISFVAATFLAVPFYYLWRDVGPTYFYFLPPVYLKIPFWDCVKLFIVMNILNHAVLPRFVSSSSSSSAKVEKDDK